MDDTTPLAAPPPLVLLGISHMTPRCQLGRSTILVDAALGLAVGLVLDHLWALAGVATVIFFFTCYRLWHSKCTCGYYERAYAELRATQAEFCAD